MANTKLPARLLDTSAIPALNVTGDLTVDTTTLKVDSTNNRVGIGIASPGYNLDILDTSTASNTGAGANINHATQPQLRFTQTTGNYRMYLGIRTNDLIIANDSGVEKVRFEQNGNVGIGTDSPDRALEVSTDGTAQLRLSRVDTTINGNNTIGSIEFMGTDDTAGTVGATIVAASSTTWGGGNYPTDLRFSTMSGSTLSEQARITSDGKVGIGNSNPRTILNFGFDHYTPAAAEADDRILNWYSAGTELHNNKIYISVVSNSVETSHPQHIGLALANKNTTDNNWSPAITFGGLSKNGNYMNGGAAIASQNYTGINDANFIGSDLHFFTKDSATSAGRNLTSKMVIGGNGNVGIGQTPGTYNKLVVKGTVVGTAANLAETAQLAILSLNYPRGNVNSGIHFGYATANYIQAADDSGANSKQLTLNPFGGNVGIGTTSPTHLLQISGGATDGRISFTNNSRGNGQADGMWVGVDNTQSFVLSRGAYPLTFYTNATPRMQIDSVGRVTMPYQPTWGAQSLSNASASGATTSAGTLVFSGLINNNGNHYSNSTGLFTAPVAGQYFVTFSGLYDDSANTTGPAYIRRNTTNLYRGYHQNSGSSYLQVSMSGVVECSVGDSISIYSGMAGWHIGGETSWSGFLIG